MFNDLSRFRSFRKAPRGDCLQAGTALAPILGYGTVDLQITKPNGSRGILTLRKVAFSTEFVVNIVSFHLLKKRDIFWDTKKNNLIRGHDDSIICSLTEKAGHQVLEDLGDFHPSARRPKSAFQTATEKKRERITSRDPRPASKGDGHLWHARMGHPGPLSLHKLGTHCLGVALKGPKTVECEFCIKAKMKRQISRREREREITAPFQEISIDWSDLEDAYEGYVRVMFITDTFSGLVFSYFMSTHGEEKENLKILKDFFNWVKERYKRDIHIVRSDNELARTKTTRWLHKKGCAIEPSAPRTQEQNGTAERSGGVIMERARAMRLAANLPHDLWKEIINTAVYLFNRTPKYGLEWKTPYEVFFASAAISDPGSSRGTKKPQLAHLKAYGCKAYAMTQTAQLKRRRNWKLDARAQIGYIVGYDSTNIFRIWVPHKGTVISSRDVRFDDLSFFDERQDLDLGIPIEQLDDLIAKVTIPETLAHNESILEEDDEDEAEPDSDHTDREGSEASDSDSAGVAAFGEKEDLELAEALENTLPPYTSTNRPRRLCLQRASPTVWRRVSSTI